MAAKRRPPPAALTIQPPHTIVLALPADDDSDDASPLKPRSLRNLKKLSLTLPPSAPPTPSVRPRRPSVMSLPSPAAPTPAAAIHRREEDGDDPAPYPDGPLQIIPGIWLGSEDNARDWKGLVERGIKSILNVAKEVNSPLDPVLATQPLRAVASTPDFKHARFPDNATYHPPNPATGRPAMHYLKLQWSHGQQDLVNVGFPAAMAFTDAALHRGEGVLVHCQCGISRSATLVIALVMRAAAQHSTSVPPEVWDLKGMQEAYSFVKEKSKWVGPNMSLIYQLLEYEKKLKGDSPSPSDSEKSSLVDEEEWSRQRRIFDESPSDPDDERESSAVMREAQALDKAMEDRIVARQSSLSSLVSTTSGVGMGPAWRSRYGPSRKRAGSVASNVTNGSLLSDDLVEEDEEEHPLGSAFNLDSPRKLCLSGDTAVSSAYSSSSDDQKPTPIAPKRAHSFTPTTGRRPPPSAPAWKSSFHIPPPPASAVRSTFNIPPPPKSAVRSSFNIPARPPLPSKRRPAPIGILPPVPSSPIALVVESPPPPISPVKPAPPSNPPASKRTSSLSLPPVRVRTESKKLLPPPLRLLQKKKQPAPDSSTQQPSFVSTPAHSQTLFVFPPSPTITTRTPSTMTLMSNMSGPVPFPSLATPRVSTFRSQGRTRSYIGLGVPATPTTGFSKVDARGYVGLE